MYASDVEPKNMVNINAFLVPRPIFSSSISSLILYIEKYGMKPRNPRKPPFPSAKYSRLRTDRKPRYHIIFFIVCLLFYSMQTISGQMTQSIKHLLYISNIMLYISNFIYIKLSPPTGAFLCISTRDAAHLLH